MTSCRDIQALLSLRLDEPLDAQREAVVGDHLRHCATCADVDADLRRLVERARELGPEPAPPPHVWAAIDAAVRREARAAGEEVTPPMRSSTWGWPAISSALAAAAFAGWFVGASLPRPSTAVTSEVAGGSIESVTEQLDLAMSHYHQAVAELEQLAAAGEAGIDPVVATSVRESLATLDRAIAESRAALSESPFSVPARTSLFEAMQRKAGVLEDAVLLINETQDVTPAETSPAIPGREL